MTANEFSRYASKRRTAEAHPCIFRSTVNAAKKPGNVDPIFHDWSNSFLAI
jgi:hypothetical protein